MPCKYWDCGWCYAPEDVEANEINGQCNDMDACPQSIPMTALIFDPPARQLQFIDTGDDNEEHW